MDWNWSTWHSPSPSPAWTHDLPELSEPWDGGNAATVAPGHSFQLLQGRDGARGAWEEGGALQDPAKCKFRDDRQACES